jgi:dipeptidyl aminopeptidase/acylaminoacyl peptidase
MGRTSVTNLAVWASLVCSQLITATHVGFSAQRSTRPVTVADCISMVRTADTLHGREIAHFSSDGSRIAVILRKGNLERNTNDFSIVLWRTNALSSPSGPEVLVKMSSSSNDDAIEDLKWVADGHRFAFLGEDSAHTRQVFEFDILTKHLKQLTSHRGGVSSYSIDATGHVVAYIAKDCARSLVTARSKRYGLLVSTQQLDKLILDQSDQHYQLFVQRSAARPIRIDLPQRITDFSPKPFLSPDGNRLVVPVYAFTAPQAWREYSDPYIQEMVRLTLVPGQQARFTQYMWCDLRSGSKGILLDVPGVSIAWRVLWSPDSNSVAIGDTYLPLDQTEGEERILRQNETFTVEITLPTGKVEKIATQGLTLIGWDPISQCLFFEKDTENWSIGNGTQRIWFAKRRGRWIEVGTPTFWQRVPEVFVEEDMNTPPRIVAFNPTTSHKVVLLELNPQFSELRFARVDEISWTNSAGVESKAGLYYPIDFVPGRQYPLVIQTHDWRRDRFFIDGPFSTAFAAQPLAGTNIFVLQLNELISDESPKEVDANIELFEDGIEYLDNLGLIDRDRVGIVAFSYTCLHVEYALTHSKLHFAAASITDGIDAGYWQYLGAINSSPLFAHQYEIANGGVPFGPGLSSWLARSPSFAIDKVTTPVRLTALNGQSLLFEWEWFAALTRLNKPVELIYIDDGIHELQRPWDRMISQQGTVDWFTFWLKGEEDPDPHKEDQYLRWKQMRRQH